MVELHDRDTGTTIGAITEDQLQFLVDSLEEESQEDTDYYVNRETLDMLAERGADTALLAILRQALGTRDEMEIQWTRS
jgi:processive 1,2-diacylglycerol beta-glucosyltransferase